MIRQILDTIVHTISRIYDFLGYSLMVLSIIFVVWAIVGLIVWAIRKEIRKNKEREKDSE